MKAQQATAELFKLSQERRKTTADVKQEGYRFIGALEHTLLIRTSFSNAPIGSGMSANAVTVTNAVQEQIVSSIQTTVVDPSTQALQESQSNFNNI